MARVMTKESIAVGLASRR